MTALGAPTLPIPPMPQVEHYAGPMARFALAAMRHAVDPRPDAPRIVMFLAPWYRQAAAWFAVGLGIAMAVRTGARIEFLINDLPYPAIHPYELNEIAALDAFCRQFETFFPYSRLSSSLTPAASERLDTLEAIIAQSLRLDTRHRVGCGSLPRAGAPAFPASARTPLTHIAAAVDNFLARERPDIIFCPGGAANGSYVVHRLAHLHGIRFASADSDLGQQYLACHSIAGHLSENADTYRHLRQLPADVIEAARAKGRDLLANKVREAEARADKLPPCDIILALGYDWDTGALGLDSLYELQTQWMIATVDHILRNHPKTHMVVRHHPYEATFASAENQELAAKLEQQRIPTLHVMRAKDQVPVYGLFRHAKAAVACQSTTILEAQAMGVPAVSMRATHYVKAGVITRPTSRAAYFNWLDAHLTGRGEAVTQAQRDAAFLDYFILQTSMAQPTRFTPHAADFWTWLHGDPVADLRSEVVADMVRCIVADVPISTITARRVLGLPGLPDGIADPVAAWLS